MTISPKLKKQILALPKEASAEILLEPENTTNKLSQDVLAKKILELIDTWLPDESSDIIINEFKNILGETGLKLLAKEFEHRLKLAYIQHNEHLAGHAYYHLCNCLEAANDVDEYLRIFKNYKIDSDHAKIRLACFLNKVSQGEEALKILEEPHFSVYAEIERLKVIADSYDLVNESDKARECRWDAFRISILNTDSLSEYLSKIPDQERDQEKARALKYMIENAELVYILEILVNGSDKENLDTLVQLRHKEISPMWLYEHRNSLEAALKLLDPEYPLAASLIYRSLIEEALRIASTQKYNAAAKRLIKLNRLNLKVQDYKSFTEHDDYLKELQELHSKKISFWNKYNLLKIESEKGRADN